MNNKCKVFGVWFHSTPGLSLRTPESPNEYALKRLISVRRFMKISVRFLVAITSPTFHRLPDSRVSRLLEKSLKDSYSRWQAKRSQIRHYSHSCNIRPWEVGQRTSSFFHDDIRRSPTTSSWLNRKQSFRLKKTCQSFGLQSRSKRNRLKWTKLTTSFQKLPGRMRYWRWLLLNCRNKS